MFNQGLHLTMKAQSTRNVPSIWVQILWNYIWQSMWLSATFGPLYFLLGVLPYLVDLPDWYPTPNRPILGAIFFLSVFGIVFSWLRMRGYIKFCDE